jgi:hypothetical protein
MSLRKETAQVSDDATVKLFIRADKGREYRRIALHKRPESSKSIPPKTLFSLVSKRFQTAWRKLGYLAIKNFDCIPKAGCTTLFGSAVLNLFPRMIVASCVSQFFRCYHVLHLFDSHMVLMHSLAHEVLTEIESESFKLAVPKGQGILERPI